MRTLLLHGFTGGATSFQHLGLDAATPELPGHGRAPPVASWDAALDALSPWLEPGQVVLGGYSMGARLALALALRSPGKVAKLVLESGTAGIEDAAERARRRAEDEELARFLEREGTAKFVERWEAHPTLASLRPFADRLRSQRLAHGAAGLASALRAMGTGAQPSLWRELPALQVPVVLLAGARDAKFSALARRLQERLPRAELRLVPDCGHAPHLEHPHAFKEALQ